MKKERVLYSFKGFKVIEKPNYLLVVNTRKPFDEGHTHLTNGNLDTAIAMIKLVYNQELPDSRDVYFLTSLIRLSKDRKYRLRIDKLIKSIEYDVPFYDI